MGPALINVTIRVLSTQTIFMFNNEECTQNSIEQNDISVTDKCKVSFGAVDVRRSNYATNIQLMHAIDCRNNFSKVDGRPPLAA